MEAVDIVEALNQYHEEQSIGGQFILQKKVEPNETVKAYKTYEYIVWFIKNKSKTKAASVSYTGRVVTNKEEEITNKNLSTNLTKVLFKFVSSNDYAKIVYGVQ